MLLRFYAVGREIAGVDDARFEVDDFTALAAALEHTYGDRMGRLAAASTLLRDGVRHRITDDIRLTASDVVDLLPPFAGG